MEMFGPLVGPVLIKDYVIFNMPYPLNHSEENFPAILNPFSQSNTPHFDFDITEETPSVFQMNTHDDEPLIKLVNDVILHAMQQAVSDIHIEPYEKHYRIRYRRDGLLYEVTRLPVHLALRFTTRLKVMARLDIAERRLPQDGRFHFPPIDIRINMCPTLFGEKIVLRILDKNRLSLNLNELGFSEIQKQLFISKISEPHGLILVTGPTGSGKTVTLYSALNYLNTIERNISTVEDPVEIQLYGINQVNIQPKIGLEFDTILCNLLRQDPDVIMIGEIRDKKTADIAIQAAHTGHLVFSTLHTNNAIETISRLAALGMNPHHIASSISLIVAQRLIRKLCPLCKKPDSTQHNIFQAVGCQQCFQGYKGRIGIYELLPFTADISELISRGTDLSLKNIAEINAGQSLFKSAQEKIQQGITSFDEVQRVI